MNNTLTNSKVEHAHLLLKISYGLLFIIAGSDKFFHLVVNWKQYVNPNILSIMDYPHLKVLISIIEILLGIMVLTRWTRAGAYGIAIWFTIIIINLLAMWHYFDIAARDAVLGAGAIALAWLNEGLQLRD